MLLPDGARFFCTAVYDFQASSPSELSFKAGASLAVVAFDVDGWGDAILAGVAGEFPVNRTDCVQVAARLHIAPRAAAAAEAESPPREPSSPHRASPPRSTPPTDADLVLLSMLQGGSLEAPDDAAADAPAPHSPGSTPVAPAKPKMAPKPKVAVKKRPSSVVKGARVSQSGEQ